MPFAAEIGLVFNCGFCHTVVYECWCKKSKKTSGKRQPESCYSDQSTQAMSQSSDSTVTQTVEDVGETQESKVCALPDEKDRFKVLFSGNQLQ